MQVRSCWHSSTFIALTLTLTLKHFDDLGLGSVHLFSPWSPLVWLSTVDLHSTWEVWSVQLCCFRVCENCLIHFRREIRINELYLRSWVFMTCIPVLSVSWVICLSSESTCNSSRCFLFEVFEDCWTSSNSLVGLEVTYSRISTLSRLNFYPSWSSWTNMREWVLCSCR